MRISEPGNQYVVGLTPDLMKTLEQLAVANAQQKAALAKALQPLLEQVSRSWANFPSLPVLPPPPPALFPPLPRIPLPPFHPPPCDHTTLEAEVARLQGENKKLCADNRTLRSTLLGLTLEADLQQDIDSPGDWTDYRFSEN